MISIRYVLAGYTPKFLKSPVYKRLYKDIGADYHLDGLDFVGRRVLIVGPAKTVHDELKAIDVSGYDIVVRMNNGLFSEFKDSSGVPLGCNVLFHSLTHDLRKVTPNDLRRAGVKLVVHRTPKRSAFLSTLLAERDLKRIAQVKIIKPERYDELAARLGSFSPTTGLVCASFFLGAPVSEVAIVGFTFFSTKYVQGYDAAVTSDAIALERVVSAGHHSPYAEAALFHELVERARAEGRNVVLGRQVEESVARLARVV
ncbi:hypothetical protein [Falsirhodobacter deserti]|uniref:hypothetical protein n=1 Tax=Falsirhodobacter deserti TaxID=1365611 RepID=UPI000FE40C47|nr:hypothetical protein [Falsirhodobacter deserti]